MGTSNYITDTLLLEISRCSDVYALKIGVKMTLSFHIATKEFPVYCQV